MGRWSHTRTVTRTRSVGFTRSDGTSAGHETTHCKYVSSDHHKPRCFVFARSDLICSYDDDLNGSWFHTRTDSIQIASFLGLFIPLVASILPIRNALDVNLYESLDTKHSKT